MEAAGVAEVDQSHGDCHGNPARRSARLGVRFRACRTERPSDTPLRLRQEQAGQRPRWTGYRLPAAMDLRSPSSSRRDTRGVRQLAAHPRRRWRRRLDPGRIAVRPKDRVGCSLVSGQAGASSKPFPAQLGSQRRHRAARSRYGGYVRWCVVLRSSRDFLGLRSADPTVGRVSRRSVLMRGRSCDRSAQRSSARRYRSSRIHRLTQH